MNTIAAPNVPRMLPIVESPYRRPDTAPAFSTDGSASRIANGLTVPSSVTGTANSASAAKNEPTAAPTDAVSSSLTVASRNGPRDERDHGDRQRRDEDDAPEQPARGRRSASRPPNQ